MFKKIFTKYKEQVLKNPNKKGSMRANFIMTLLCGYGTALSINMAIVGSGWFYSVMAVFLGIITLDAVVSFFILKRAVKKEQGK